MLFLSGWFEIQHIDFQNKEVENSLWKFINKFPHQFKSAVESKFQILLNRRITIKPTVRLFTATTTHSPSSSSEGISQDSRTKRVAARKSVHQRMKKKPLESKHEQAAAEILADMSPRADTALSDTSETPTSEKNEFSPPNSPLARPKSFLDVDVTQFAQLWTLLDLKNFSEISRLEFLPNYASVNWDRMLERSNKVGIIHY